MVDRRSNRGGGGAVAVAVANFTGGTLTVRDSTFAGNFAVSIGGAIINQGVVAGLVNSTFSDNVAGVKGGAISPLPGCGQDSGDQRSGEREDFGSAERVPRGVVRGSHAQLGTRIEQRGLIGVQDQDRNARPPRSRCDQARAHGDSARCARSYSRRTLRAGK